MMGIPMKALLPHEGREAGRQNARNEVESDADSGKANSAKDASDLSDASGASDANDASASGCVVGIAAGGGTTCALKSNGTVWCWGANRVGQLGNGTTSEMETTPVPVTALGSTVAEIAISHTHGCARKRDGSMWCWGTNFAGQLGDGTTHDRPTPVAVAALGNDVTQIACGANHTCARK